MEYIPDFASEKSIIFSPSPSTKIDLSVTTSPSFGENGACPPNPGGSIHPLLR